MQDDAADFVALLFAPQLRQMFGADLQHMFEVEAKCGCGTGFSTRTCEEALEVIVHVPAVASVTLESLLDDLSGPKIIEGPSVL